MGVWVALLVLPLAGCPGSSNDLNGGSAGSRATTPPFSADSAWAYLQKQVSFGPRVSGMPGHAAQLAWMKEFLRARADSLMVQEFTHTHSQSGKKLNMANLLARFRPQADVRVLIIAHWDTRPTADQDEDPVKAKQPIDGANDGASGSAVLLELANVLKKHSAPIGVDLLFVDGEDYGPGSDDMYVGAAYFAANKPSAYQPMYGILLDMIGDANPVFPYEGNSQDMAPEVVERVWRTAEQIGLGQFFPRKSGGYITDDHIKLNEGGIRTIDIIDFQYPHWHTSEDTVANTSPRGLDAVGRVITELIYRGG